MSKVFSSRVVCRECLYDPRFDLQEVDQFGFVNLSEAYERGIIPGSLDFSDDSFNGVSNPGTLISRSMDVFDGLRKAEYVRSQLKRLNAEDREKVENQVERSNESVPDSVTTS